MDQPDVLEVWIGKFRNWPPFVFLRKHRSGLLYLLFAAVALVECLFYSYKVPYAQVPDEITHYQLMEEEFGTTGYVDNMISGVYYPGSYYLLPGNPAAKVDREAAAGVADSRFSKDLQLSLHPKLTALRHLPAGIGFYLGAWLDLPMVTCAAMAELFSILFFVGMGYLTLRTAPVKKEIFAFCMLIPETLQQCASINYDAVVIPCSLFLFAYILKLYNMENPVRWRNLAVVALVTFVLVVVKLPYSLIVLTIFIIPAKHYRLMIGKRFELAGWIRRFWVVPLVLGLAAVGGGIYLMRDNSIVKTAIADFLYFREFLALLKNTLKTLGFYRVTQMVGMFGWLDSQVSGLFLVIFFMMMIYLNACRAETLNRELTVPRRGWLLLVAVVIVVAIEIALQEWTYQYLSWDRTVGIEQFCEYILFTSQVLGVQGRYWIPALPIFLVAVSGANPREHRKGYWIVQICFYAFSFYYVMSILNERYWL